METPKRKALPDLRPRVGSYPERPDRDGNQWTLPSMEVVASLAQKHGFKDASALGDQLENALLWWRFDVQTGDPISGSTRRSFLTELAKRADLLWEALEKAGGPERSRVLDAAAPLAGGKDLDLTKLAGQMRLLRLAALVAARQTPMSSAGKRGNPEVIELVAKLWRIYRGALGAAARRITRSGDQYSGAFFDFVKDVFELAEIRKSNNGLGKAIEKAQAAVRKTDARRQSR